MDQKNKFKHTPGPWKVVFKGDITISLAQWETLFPVENDEHYEQVNTLDVALIETAPELLAALEFFVSQAEAVDPQDRAAIMARRILAKATGLSKN